jgi:localization factor PodJL
MKSGGPWNLRDLRPEAREAAREAARRSGMSVGEWLNSVIQQSDDDDYGEPMRHADFDDEDDGWRDDNRREYRRDYRRESGHERAPRREQRPRREREREIERETALEREAALAREEFGEVHARLDRLTSQLERMARSESPRLTGAPPPPPRPGRAPAAPRARAEARAGADTESLSIDDAVVEITQRQCTLYGEAAAAPPPIPPAPPPGNSAADAAIIAAGAAPTFDIAGLEKQLRQITTRIETLRPSSDLEAVVAALRDDLTDIRRQLTEALPRHAVGSLEIEVQALAQRIDHSRESGVEAAAIAGLERGLTEVRDALRGLTTAENLVGFDDAVKTLAQKVDLIIAREDPAALQQLETAIGALRGIVSHVASNDTLTKVAEDVRALAAKVDALAISVASGQAVSQLENRIETLASALNASAEAGHAVPRELEKLLSGLIEKLEWVQLTHTDHAALGHLEDRIAQLIKRLDASEARLGNLEAVERGLADLLVHLEKLRGVEAPAEPGLKIPLGSADLIEREVAEIKRSERRTQDSLEADHGAVEQVVDRLAMIESDMHRDAAPQSAPIAEMPAEAADTHTVEPPPAPPVAIEPAWHRPGAPRPPLDPSLPPDHPLEPGSAPGSRPMPSAADRIAASEAALGAAKPPVIAEPEEKPNFIAAARRAAQAAAATPYDRPAKAEAAAIRASRKGQPSRFRKLIVAGAAVLIAIGCVHIALRAFQDSGSGAKPQPEQAAPPAVLPDSEQPKALLPHAGPLVLPVPDTASSTPPATVPAEEPPKAPQSIPSPTPPAVAPAASQRQSALHDLTVLPSIAAASPPAAPNAKPSALPQLVSPDVTGSVRPMAPQNPAPSLATPNAMIADKLPATIGGPSLRAAAMAGEPVAEFEVATRFAEGRGVPPSNEQAAHWLERAAKQGLAPAQFRLGGFFEKGIGVKKDLAAARDLYLAAAEKGNGKAMHNLAVLYAEGINGPADYRLAAQWFRKAADRGVTDSQYNLAILYARGIGVEQNYAESYKWFLLAANQGDNEATKKRDEVASHLDQQSLAAAQAAVQKWSAEPQQSEDAINVKAPPGGWDAPAKGAQSAKPKARSAGAKTSDSDSKIY